MIRRAHQIASAVFTEACLDLDLTPAQYAVLFTLRYRDPLGQNEVSRAVALDRATTSLVVSNLAERDLLLRADDPDDRRRAILHLTSDGRLLLARAERLATAANREMLSVFSRTQARTFIGLLAHFTAAHAERQEN
jgi:DNA-binding MarR family transcriptional regulator